MGDLGASRVLYVDRVQGVRLCEGCQVLHRCLENKHPYGHMSETISSEKAKLDGVGGLLRLQIKRASHRSGPWALLNSSIGIFGMQSRPSSNHLQTVGQ